MLMFIVASNNFQIETAVGLIDLSGLSMRQLYMPGLTYLTRVIPIYENNYPYGILPELIFFRCV